MRRLTGFASPRSSRQAHLPARSTSFRCRRSRPTRRSRERIRHGESARWGQRSTRWRRSTSPAGRAWVATTGGTWYAAGRRGASAHGRRRVRHLRRRQLGAERAVVRRTTGRRQARVNMRVFLQGPVRRRRRATAARGTVFIAGIGQRTRTFPSIRRGCRTGTRTRGSGATSSHYVSDWSQELYGDIRTTPSPVRRQKHAVTRSTSTCSTRFPSRRRRTATAAAARAFLTATYSPLANAAWQYDAFLRLDERSRRADAGLRLGANVRECRGANSRFGFAWSPRNLAGYPRETSALKPTRCSCGSQPRSRTRLQTAGGGLWLDVVQPRSRRRRHDDRLADLRNMEAIRPSPSPRPHNLYRPAHHPHP